MHEKYMLVNLETVDLADMMIMDEENLGDPDDQYLGRLLEEYGLSLDRLEESGATIQNVDKTLYIRFDQGACPVFQVSPLERLELPAYIALATSYNLPKKVIVYEVSAQIGGIIDTHYGIKFKIRHTSEAVSPISPERHTISEEDNSSTLIFLKAIHGIQADDTSYDGSIDLIINRMYEFWEEAMRQLRFIEAGNIANTSKPVYTKGNEFSLMKCGDHYCATAYFDDPKNHVVYTVNDRGEVEIAGATKEIESVCLEFNKYLRRMV